MQGDENTILRKIKFKQLHGGFFTSDALGKIVPEINVMQIPLMFTNYDEFFYVLDRMKNDFQKMFKEKGFVVLG